MKRYIITNKIIKEIKNHPKSMDKLSDELGFEIRNIVYRNKSINENHLIKLKTYLRINPILKEIRFDYSKNLGRYSFTQPIKTIRRNSKLAEFIGIMLGDGNIWKDQIRIAFDKRNQTYINYVGELFIDLFGAVPKKLEIKDKNTSYLYFYNKNLVKKLISLGLKRGNKIANQLGVPKWIIRKRSYSKNCVKGLIDTDGCIYFSKRDRQKYIKFTNFNQQLLTDFRDITSNLGYNFARANNRNLCLYRKKEVARFINDIKPMKSM